MRDKIVDCLVKYLGSTKDEVNYALKRAFNDNIGSNGNTLISDALGEYTLEEFRTARTILEYLMVGGSD